MGAQGFLGEALFNAYRRAYPDLIGTHYHEGPYKKLDLSNPKLDTFDLRGYNYAIISAAIPNIRSCELDPVRTHQVNVEGTLKLAEMLIEKKITPVLFSTDYVFDGQTGLYNESSIPKPLNEYGKQKAQLEQLISQSFKNQCLMIRLSKIYSTQKGDRSLLDEMIHSLVNGTPIRAAYDQIFCPIEINDVVNAIMHLQNKDARGLYHVCGHEAITRLELAQMISKKLKIEENMIQRISLDDLKEPFIRPKNTGMINQKLCNETGIHLKSLSSSIDLLVEQYKKEV